MQPGKAGLAFAFTHGYPRLRSAGRNIVAALAFVTCGSLLAHSTLAPEPLAVTASEKKQQSFVPLRSVPAGTQVYAVFRKELELASAPKAAFLNLFADSRYIVWVNGRYVERWPCGFDPIAPGYDALDLPDPRSAQSARRAKQLQSKPTE